MEYTKGRRDLAFERQQALNSARNGAMEKACAGLTTAQLNKLNPHLIASAPDLYKACKFALDVLVIEKRDTDNAMVCQAKLRQALAKAEGK